MTICVAVKVSEGLVLAADSTAAVQGSVRDASGQSATGILKTYDHGRKLSHIKDYPIGTLSWGTALIGARSVESLIKEFEYTLHSVQEEHEKRREARIAGREEETPFTYDVRAIASGLMSHISEYYASEFENAPERPALGILVSGYSSGKFFPEQWLIDIPHSAELIELRPDQNGRPSFGANWFGLTDAINRLHKGVDDRAILKLAQHQQSPPEEARRFFAELEYFVMFDGMPLQDAIDYATYLVNVTIGRFRFVIGAPLCGGEIDVAVITPNEFTWVQRKSWKTGNSPGSK